MKDNIIHLDCTLRDGGYYTNWDFSDEFVRNYLTAIDSACIDYVEIGFRSFYNKGFKGAYAFCYDDFLNKLCIPKRLKVALMINADDLILDGHFSKDRILKIVPTERKGSRVNLIRIACSHENFRIIMPAFKILKEKGYLSAANIMQVSKLNNEELNEIGELATKNFVDVLYFADSLGSLEPESIKSIIRSLKHTWKGELGFHAHDNKGFALINTLMSIDYGVSWVDTTINGMGRGAGNARTEDLLLSFDEAKKDKLYLIPLLKIIKNSFVSWRNKYRWGTNPYYFLAAKFSIHPTYIQTILSDDRFKEEDILSVIEYLKSEDSAKFLFNNLESAKKFYHGDPIGTFASRSILHNKDVLILGSGKNVSSYKNALENFILKNNPIVIALNTTSQIDETLIDFRIASNPMRLMADLEIYLNLSQPLITPLSMLPNALSEKLADKEVLDYGIAISNHSFEFHETFGIIPSQLVFAYALSFIASGKAKNAFLAGFEGYESGDVRNNEINQLIDRFNQSNSNLRLISVTPSQYSGLEEKSIYGM